MELLIEVDVSALSSQAPLDVKVDVEPEASIAELIAALRDHVTSRGVGSLPDADRLMAMAEPVGRVLERDDSVLGSALVSGETVVLRPRPAATATTGPGGRVATSTAPADRPDEAPEQRDRVVALDVGSGPSAGLTKLLGPGRYEVGRSRDCEVRIDDSTVSRTHMTLVVGPDLSVELTAQPDSTNGTWIDGEFLRGSRRIAPGSRVTLGATEVTLRLVTPSKTRPRDRLGQIPFNRMPYKRPVVHTRQFEPLDKPPKKPEPRKIPLITALVPLVGAGAIVLLTGRWFFVILSVMSPFMLLARSRSAKKEGNRRYRHQRDEFLQQLDQRVREVDEALAAEQRERFTAAPDLAELSRQATLQQARLWERNRRTSDLMSLRLGLGNQPSQLDQPAVTSGDLDLRNEATRRLSHAETVRRVPVVADLDELGVLGLFHDPDQVTALGASLVVQAACLHSPEDLVLAAAVSSENLARWRWLKWLPHTRAATSPLETDHLAVDGDDLNRLLVGLLRVAAARLGSQQRVPDGHWPRVLLLLDETAEPDRAILAQLLDVAPAAGIRVLWLGRSEYGLPRQCRGIVRCVVPDEGTATLRDTDPDVADQELTLEGIGGETALGIARALAPIRDASAASLTTAIPRTVLLLDALGMPEPNPQEIIRRWRASSNRYSLELPLGMGPDGLFGLDLVEHGPHVLIAGTSGAGKSELLQTMVGSLAAQHPPERLNFLFIDYKGGAAAAPFERLPHTVGSVTNLDAQLSLRALTSLRAELNWRMALLEGRAKDLGEMLTVAPDEAPPSLVIVVDEFATLVKEIPDFVAGMVDIAQRGRSLGIHLVLATQRPTGSVNDNILANTNLRISLRVLDPADSNAIIGTKDAAEIPVPLRGRAYARSGPGALQPFQCAWSGAPFEPVQAAAPVTTRSFPFGRATAADEDTDSSSPDAVVRPAADEPARPDHLEVVVTACAEAASALDTPPPRRPWVEPLPPVVPLDDVVTRLGARLRSDPGRLAVIGLADQPEAQTQRAEVVDLEASGGLLVFGAGGAGKTTALRTVAAGMATQGGADGVQLYGFDFTGRTLHQLRDLPHTVAVATGDELELVTRVLTLLRQEVERRRDLLAEHQAESVSALRSRLRDLGVPRLILLLDGYSSFQSTFDRGDLFPWQEVLRRIVADGRQVGIHAVFATDRRQGLPSGLFSAMGARLALRMSSPEELVALGVPNKVAKDLDLGDGRALLDGAIEVQVACVAEDAGGAAQADALRRMGEAAADRSSARPRPLPQLPEKASSDQRPSGRLSVPLGLADLTMDVVDVDLTRQNLVVTGPPLSGQSTALATAAQALARGPEPPAFVAVGGASSPLADLAVWARAGFARTQVVPALEAAVELVGDDETIDVRLVLFVDAVEDVDGPDRAKLLERLVRSDAVRVVAAIDPVTLSKAYSGWASDLRRNRALLFLQPAPKGDVDQLTGIKPTLRPGQPMPPGRGVLVADRGWHLVQVLLPPD